MININCRKFTQVFHEITELIEFSWFLVNPGDPIFQPQPRKFWKFPQSSLSILNFLFPYFFSWMNRSLWRRLDKADFCSWGNPFENMDLNVYSHNQINCLLSPLTAFSCLSFWLSLWHPLQCFVLSRCILGQRSIVPMVWYFFFGHFSLLFLSVSG